MKKLSAIVLFALVYGGTVFAQDSTDPTLDEVKAARKTMEVIELSLIRSSDDKHAAALILESKNTAEDANLYLIEVPGYEQAIADKTLLEFKKDVKSKDKLYRKLAKTASKAKTEKQEYLASINPNYQEALELYTEATN